MACAYIFCFLLLQTSEASQWCGCYGWSLVWALVALFTTAKLRLFAGGPLGLRYCFVYNTFLHRKKKLDWLHINSNTTPFFLGHFNHNPKLLFISEIIILSNFFLCHEYSIRLMNRIKFCQVQIQDIYLLICYKIDLCTYIKSKLQTTKFLNDYLNYDTQK